MLGLLPNLIAVKDEVKGLFAGISHASPESIEGNFSGLV
jgi:hypothetical protein